MKQPIDFIREFILPHENAYAPGHDGDPDFVVAEHVANDPGGTTKYGIDAESHPGVDIAALTQTAAESIYLTEYAATQWTDGSGDSVLNSMPYPANLAFFDAQVNQGTRAATVIAQRALGIADDGILGTESRKLIEATQGQFLGRSITTERMTTYHSLARKDPERFGRFLAGWLNRCADLTAYLNALPQ